MQCAPTTADSMRWTATIVIGWLLIVFGIAIDCQCETTDTRVVALGNRCGLFAMATACGVLQADFRYTDVAPILDREQHNSSFDDLDKAANKLGLVSRGVEFVEGFPKLTAGKVVAIIPVRSQPDERHFVTLTADRSGELWLIDFPSSAQQTSQDALRSEKGWDGKALLIARSVGELTKTTEPSTQRRWFTFLSFGLLAIAAAFFVVKWSRPQNRNSHPGRRSGFTVVELLVSMALIGVLMSLALPAIFAAQARSRRIECLNHIRQQGHALHSYVEMHRHFPTMRLGDAQSSNASASTSILVSWQAHLLPFVEQTNVWKTFDPAFNDFAIYADPPVLPDNLRTRVALFECPADKVPMGGTSYRGCTGTSPSFHGATGATIAESSMPGWISGLTRTSGDISDGLSNTIFLSERVAGDHSGGAYFPLTDIALVGNGALKLPGDAWALCQSVTLAVPGHFSSAGATWFAGGYGHAWYNHVLPPNSRIPDCTSSLTLLPTAEGAYAARSYHTQGVNVAFGDGSGRFINESIALNVWRGLGTIQGREVIPHGE